MGSEESEVTEIDYKKRYEAALKLILEIERTRFSYINIPYPGDEQITTLLEHWIDQALEKADNK
jgi:hypothetical protein